MRRCPRWQASRAASEAALPCARARFPAAPLWQPRPCPMPDSLTVAPTSDPRRVRAPDGTLLSPPAGWALLPPGDAGLTRRVKAAGPSWTVVEKKGRKMFSRGVWAPEAHISAARAALEAERATPAYAKRRASDAARREREQAEYEVDFANAVLRFLRLRARLRRARQAAGCAGHRPRHPRRQRHRGAHRAHPRRAPRRGRRHRLAAPPDHRATTT